MTSLPDWLVERTALDEVPAASRDRVERADPRVLADQVAALREANAAELARHPAAPAVVQLEARVTAEVQRRAARRRRRFGLLGLATGAAAVLLVTRLGTERTVDDPVRGGVTQGDGTRVKGAARILVFRQAGAQIERLEQDTEVRAGDLIQLRYNAGGQRFGLIASIDGAGGVTLHFPPREDALPDATAVPPDTATLPDAYALDDAPRFERFVFITANDPIDVPQALAALRALAGRADSATALLELPAGVHQRSLRLRKPDPTPPHHESP